MSQVGYSAGKVARAPAGCDRKDAVSGTGAWCELHALPVSQAGVAIAIPAQSGEVELHGVVHTTSAQAPGMLQPPSAWTLPTCSFEAARVEAHDGLPFIGRHIAR